MRNNEVVTRKEYIEREAVLRYIDHMPSELTHDGRRMIRRIRLTEYISDSIQAADVAPVRHGRWISTGTEWVCSECGEEPWWLGVTEDVLPPYCPNCGARMDLKDGDGDV